MSAISVSTKPLPTMFETLNKRFPLYRIQDEQAYEGARALAQELAMLDEPAVGQLQYLDTLAVLMEAYEREHHVSRNRSASGVEVLKLLVSENNLTASELGRILGHRQLGSALLRGQRDLSKQHMIALGLYFNVDPGVFMDRPQADTHRRRSSPPRSRREPAKPSSQVMKPRRAKPKRAAAL